MKRQIALLLAVCIIAGVSACGKKDTSATDATAATVFSEVTEDSKFTEPTKYFDVTETTAETTGTIITAPTESTVVTESTLITEATKPNPATSPYNGKTIEIYGLGSETAYTDFSQYDETYLWMMRAAVDEWAEINGVTLIFSGNYDQHKISTAIDMGSGPDVIFYTDKFPAITNSDMLATFTDAEYKKLADIGSPGYLDLLNYRTKTYGFVLPWAGNTMCYYNKTMFQRYDVKTPMEYFLEGEWTWESFQKCMVEMTKDTNADGKVDTYGLAGDSLAWCRMVNPFKMDDTGKLVNTIDDPMIQDFLQFKYDVFSVQKCAVSAKNEIYTNVASPMFAMQLSDCEPYNLKSLYHTIPNGDELEVVPVPAYEDKNVVQWKQACVSLATSCDERAAAVDMLAYLLKCGMRYMSDCSLGAVKCDYEGIQGYSALSAEFLEEFSQTCKEYADKIGDYDEELIAKIYESFQSAEWYTYQTYPGVKALTSYSEITQMCPESAIPVVKSKYESEIKKYNDLYTSES